MSIMVSEEKEGISTKGRVGKGTVQITGEDCKLPKLSMQTAQSALFGCNLLSFKHDWMETHHHLHFVLKIFYVYIPTSG